MSSSSLSSSSLTLARLQRRRWRSLHRYCPIAGATFAILLVVALTSHHHCVYSISVHHVGISSINDHRAVSISVDASKAVVAAAFARPSYMSSYTSFRSSCVSLTFANRFGTGTGSGTRTRTSIIMRDTVGVEDSSSLPSSASGTDADLVPTCDTVPPRTLPLPPDTYAGRIERALLSRFGGESNSSGSSPISRVLDSWRYLDMGYEHRRFVGHDQDPPTLLDASTSLCHQHAPSYVPGLTCRQFWNIHDFDWAKSLQSSYHEIKDEFVQVAQSPQQSNDLVRRGNNVWAGALSDSASSYGTGWKTLALMDRGRWDPINVSIFPRTARAIRDCNIPATEAFFASMDGESDIKVHSDFTNFVLTCHLPLDVPENGRNKCRLTIGDETRQWIEGSVMLFDTSILHSAVNESDRTRYILMFRLWHPDLTAVEREALQFIYDALEFPDLVSDDPAARFMAERTVEMSRSFPKLGVVDGDGDDVVDSGQIGGRSSSSASAEKFALDKGGGGKMGGKKGRDKTKGKKGRVRGGGGDRGGGKGFGA